MEAVLDEYKDQIENWQENICEITFGRYDDKSGDEFDSD